MGYRHVTTTKCFIICDECGKELLVPERYFVETGLHGNEYSNPQSGPRYDRRKLREFLDPLGWQIYIITRGPTIDEGSHGCPYYWKFHELRYSCKQCIKKRRDK